MILNKIFNEIKHAIVFNFGVSFLGHFFFKKNIFETQISLGDQNNFILLLKRRMTVPSYLYQLEVTFTEHLISLVQKYPETC